MLTRRATSLISCHVANVKQIKNLQAKDRQSVRLTHDALYNVHELAYDLEDFVYKIITFPDLIIVCGLNAVLQEPANPLDHCRPERAIVRLL